MTSAAPGLTTWKRWRLRPGADLAAVERLVREEIAPHYRVLDPAVTLGLELVVGTRDVLALQHWPDAVSRDRALTGPAFEEWWQDYLPVLARWDALVELVAEWESERLL